METHLSGDAVPPENGYQEPSDRRACVQDAVRRAARKFIDEIPFFFTFIESLFITRLILANIRHAPSFSQPDGKKSEKSDRRESTGCSLVTIYCILYPFFSYG